MLYILHSSVKTSSTFRHHVKEIKINYLFPRPPRGVMCSVTLGNANSNVGLQATIRCMPPPLLFLRRHHFNCSPGISTGIKVGNILPAPETGNTSGSSAQSSGRLVPGSKKETGGLRPILDMRALNKRRRVHKFKMLTNQRLLQSVCPPAIGSAPSTLRMRTFMCPCTRFTESS